MAIEHRTGCVVANRVIPSRARDVPNRGIVDIVRLLEIAVVGVNRRRATAAIAVPRARHENGLTHAIAAVEARATPKRTNRVNGSEVATGRDANRETTAVGTISPKPIKRRLRLDQIEGSYNHLSILIDIID